MEGCSVREEIVFFNLFQTICKFQIRKGVDNNMTNILKEKASKVVDEASKAADSAFDSAKSAVSGTVKGAEEQSGNVTDAAAEKAKTEWKKK